MTIKKVKEEVLEKIRQVPSEILRLEKEAKEFIKLLRYHGIEAQIGGSLAKGTMIVTDNKPDVDLFVLFDYSEDIIKLEEVLNKVELPGKMKLLHGSRDYFQIECSNYILELVPVIRTKDPELAENVTDVSLRHVQYVKDEIREKPELADEIRLAKAFCVARGVYGAESYIKGFSGYALEILTLHYGSFEKLLKGLINIKSRTIDTKKYFKGEKEILRELNESKIQGPLIVIDPTNKYRNITAGLNDETFDIFREYAQKFLKKPSVEYFNKRIFEKEIMMDYAKKKKAKYVEIVLVTDRQEGDIAGTKMKKFFDHFIKELEKKQQEVLMKEYDYSGKGKKAKGYLVIKEKHEIEIKGPSTGLEGAAEEFKRIRGTKAYKKGKYWYAKEKITITGILAEARKIENEMGAGGTIVSPL